MTALSDLRAAVARADEVLGCGVKTCFVKPGRGYGRCRCLTDGMAEGVIPALYKAAKALVVAEEPRERWVDAEGVTRLPRAMREQLGVGDGAHIWFLRGPERWEAWREDDMGEVYGSEDNADIEIAAKRLDEINLEPSFVIRTTPKNWAKFEATCNDPSEPNEALKALFRDGPISDDRFVFTSKPGEFDDVLKTCWCFECLDEPSMGPLNPAMRRMIVCPQCGNKRCPRATSHDNACSGSNESGQDWSRYK